MALQPAVQPLANCLKNLGNRCAGPLKCIGRGAKQQGAAMCARRIQVLLLS